MLCTVNRIQNTAINNLKNCILCTVFCILVFNHGKDTTSENADAGR